MAVTTASINVPLNYEDKSEAAQAPKATKPSKKNPGFADDPAYRYQAADLAIRWITARGSNPQTDMIALSSRIHKFLIGIDEEN